MIKEEIIIDVVDNGLEQATAKAKALSQATKGVSKDTNAMSGAMQSSSMSVLDNGGAMGLLNDATGGLAMTVKDAVEASALFTKSQKAAALMQGFYTTVVGTSTGAMKLFRIALIGTGIGAIVVGIGLLIANFDKVKEAVFKFIPPLRMVGDIFEKLVNWVTDFVGATSDASRALDAMVSKSEESIKRSEHFLDANADKFDQYTNRKYKANLEYNKKVVELAKKFEEGEIKSQKELESKLKDFRDKANREIVNAETDRQSELTKKREAAQEKINDENAKAKAKKDQLDAEALAALKKQIADELKLRLDGQAELDKALATAEFDEVNKGIQNKIDAQKILDELTPETEAEKLTREFEEKRMVLEAANMSTLELQSKYISDKEALEDASRQRIKEEEDKEAENKKIRDKAVMDNRVQIATQTVQLIAQLAGEGSAIAKGVAVAQATIDTYKGAVSAYSAMSGIPIVGPVLGGIAAGAVVVAGIANVKKILATKAVEKSAPSISAPSAPAAPSFNLVQGTGANQIAESIGGQNKPVQAFVVSSNVTSAQAMDRNIVSESKL